MLKGPKRSFVVVLLLSGVESSAKNVPNGTKNVREQKTFQVEQKYFANKILQKGTKMFVVEQKKVTE